jgi:hypothetical protein
MGYKVFEHGPFLEHPVLSRELSSFYEKISPSSTGRCTRATERARWVTNCWTHNALVDRWEKVFNREDAKKTHILFPFDLSSGTTAQNGVEKISP